MPLASTPWYTQPWLLFLHEEHLWTFNNATLPPNFGDTTPLPRVLSLLLICIYENSMHTRVTPQGHLVFQATPDCTRPCCAFLHAALGPRRMNWNALLKHPPHHCFFQFSQKQCEARTEALVSGAVKKGPHIWVRPHKDHPANLGPHVFEASKLLIHCPYFLTSQCQRESPPSPGCSANSWAAPHRPARHAQVPDGRKGLAQNQRQKQLFNG